jgi:hypothetical protein
MNQTVHSSILNTDSINEKPRCKSSPQTYKNAAPLKRKRAPTDKEREKVIGTFSGGEIEKVPVPNGVKISVF